MTKRDMVAPDPMWSRRALRRVRGRSPWRLWGPLALIATYVLAGAIGPLLLRYDAVGTSTRDRLLPPGSRTSEGALALLGTDQVGRDLLAQVLQGARISITIGIATLVLAGVIGVTLGLLSGFFGRWLDAVIMRLADVQLAFPSILLAIFIAAIVGPSVLNVILVLSITSWVAFARVTRAQTLATKRREFVDATRTLGAGSLHLLRNCILPACVAPVMVVATVELGHVILAEAALSFLGLGTPQQTPSWGVTIANGRDYLSNAWWISTMPGVALAILIVAVGTLGDELRDRYDPNLRSG